VLSDVFLYRKQKLCLQEKVDPFSLVADELQVVANRLRSMVAVEVITG